MNIAAECTTVYGPKYVPDGILNLKLYADAPIKILWLLREAWHEKAMSWVREKSVYEKTKGSPTLQPMVYVTYSVFNQYPLWAKMDYIRENPDMAEVLRSIAYVNVKKVPGGTSSDLGDIEYWFKRGEHILKEQFAECKPDVVIGSAPYMQYVFRWDAKRSAAVRGDILSYVADPGRPLLIEAQHPSQRRVRRQIYVDTLVEVIRDYVALRPKRN